MRLQFGDCVLDPDRRELKRASGAIPAGPQVFDLLLHLIENRDRVVSKDDLLETVWRGRIVSESTITSHINAARTAIGDNGQDQRFIRTVARPARVLDQTSRLFGRGAKASARTFGRACRTTSASDRRGAIQ